MLITLTRSSCSVRWSPSFFRPMVRSFTQIPPSLFTSRIWNRTLRRWSCSGPPHTSQTCGSSFVAGIGGPPTPPPTPPTPPPGSESRYSSERHWQNTSFRIGEANEPCWCIMRINKETVRFYSLVWEQGFTESREEDSSQLLTVLKVTVLANRLALPFNSPLLG